MPNRNLSVMFTDMKGFTRRTSSQSRSATLDLIKRHRDLLLPVIAHYGGRLIKGIGDAFLVTFESPTDAVLAGIALQETLANHNAGRPADEFLEIRVAINTGEVLVEENDVYGEAVNIAARIEGIAEPNEVYFTEATYLSMNRTEVPSAEIGYRILKGIPERIKVYKVLKDGETLAAVADSVAVAAGETLPSAPSGAASAPRWRRCAAFAVDLLLAGIVAGLLLAPQQKALERRHAELAERAETLTTRIAERWMEAVTRAIGGQQEVNDRLPLADEVRALRDEVRRFIADQRLQGRSRREITAAMERDPQMRRRLADFRAEAQQTLRGDVEAWLHDPHAAPPVDIEMPAAVREFRASQRQLLGHAERLGRAGGALTALLLLLHAVIATGWRGRTLGKRLLGLRVVTRDGGRIGFARALGRACAYLLSALPLGLGFLWGLIAGDRRAWHDRLAGTRVVRA